MEHNFHVAQTMGLLHAQDQDVIFLTHLPIVPLLLKHKKLQMMSSGRRAKKLKLSYWFCPHCQKDCNMKTFKNRTRLSDSSINSFVPAEDIVSRFILAYKCINDECFWL